MPVCRGLDARDRCRLRVLGQYVFYQIRPAARVYRQSAISPYNSLIFLTIAIWCSFLRQEVLTY